MERGWTKSILCLRWILCMTLPPGERVARARARPPGAPSTSSQKWVQLSSPELAFESISVSQKIWRKSIISESQTALVITLSANLFSIIMSMLFCQLHKVEINESLRLHFQTKKFPPSEIWRWLDGSLLYSSGIWLTAAALPTFSGTCWAGVKEERPESGSVRPGSTLTR